MLSVGNGEICPYCNKILDDRIESITDHLFKYHEKEIMKDLFGDVE